MFAIGRTKLYSRARYEKVLPVIKPGAIVGRKTGGYLSSAISGRRISHVGVYLGAHKHFAHAVIHADPDYGCVVIDELHTFLNSDYAEIWNPAQALESCDIDLLLARAERFTGKAYDYIFAPGTTSVYCTELVTALYANMGVHFVRETSWAGLDIIYPDTFIPTGYFYKVFHSTKTDCVVNSAGALKINLA